MRPGRDEPPPRPAPAGTITRRTVLASPLALGACQKSGQDHDIGYEGGWVGAAHLRGHLLRGGAPAAAPATVARHCAVAIVGGGVAGLAAARALLRAGVDDIRLFDLEDEPGGNARGHAMAGIACPLGAHYLPLPGPDAPEVAELLHDLGLLRSVAGRTVADERHLCHSPQERLWIDGQWTDGLLPPAPQGSARAQQYRRFAQQVAEASGRLGFAIPSRRAGWSAGLAALDAVPFTQWLQRNGVDDPALRWYLDYCCRDDYGAGADAVSAWAGLHYFASRHGFHAPGDDSGERDAVFTWPEGNAWLTRRLAAPLGDRVVTRATVTRIEASRHAVQVDVVQAPADAGADATAQRWTAQQVVVALPLHAAVRVVADAPAALRAAAAQVLHAPWLVANLHLHSPLTDKPGAPLSWDNVLYPSRAVPGTAGGPDAGRAGAPWTLGYVDAMHQSLRPMAGPTVLTAYWALGDADPAEIVRRRRALLDEPWRAWAARVVDDLARAHPDLPRRIARVDLTRHGHAMAIPVPGLRGSAALQALAQPAAPSRLHFAHGDLAGYSIFEEAFILGDAAGRAAARQRHP